MVTSILGFGVASHLGVISDICTIGVGKTLFHVDGIEKNSEHIEKVKHSKHMQRMVSLFYIRET